ncbi:hypothetical protein FKM82_022069 [Ascaphus truei]
MQDVPLHVAARLSLLAHARLYLRHGASVNLENRERETPLSVACGGKGGDEECRLDLCRLLLERGADLETPDQQERRPLHRACRGAAHRLVELLLGAGADVNAADYNGALPLSCALQNAALHRAQRPQLTVRALLNHGARGVCPDAFGKVLRCCSAAPEVIALLYNSYTDLRVCESWKVEVPGDVFQTHLSFYTTFFSLPGAVRSLQHLCRSTLRRQFGSRCHRLVPLLPVPSTVQDYLLLHSAGSLL